MQIPKVCFVRLHIQVVCFAIGKIVFGRPYMILLTRTHDYMLALNKKLETEEHHDISLLWLAFFKLQTSFLLNFN